MRLGLTLCAVLSAIGPLVAAPPPPGAPTPIDKADLDVAAFAEWVEGQERPRTDVPPTQILWTRSTGPAAHASLKFGESKSPGPRHLRLAFTRPVPVGSVLINANPLVRVSALRADATYPGDLANESHWLPAKRLAETELSLWVLSAPGMTTRAVRLSIDSPASAKTYGGEVGGVLIVESRFDNIAPQAIVLTSSNQNKVDKLTNGKMDAWASWDSGERAEVVSAKNPEWVMLTWPVEVKLAGVAALGAGFSSGDVQSYTGPATRHPREAGEGDWRTVTTSAFDPQYPRNLPVNWVAFDQPVATRALRLRITGAIDDTKAHPHLKGKATDGKRVWLHEILALRALGDADLAPLALPQETAPHPPVPVRFTLAEPGYVTLVIEDQDGKRVRNLVSETPFPAGPNTAWWDALDDVQRDDQAANHGVYHVPGQFVQPGKYRVRGLVRKQIDLRYQMTVYNPGNPPWPTADRTGGWLADHTPPSSVLFVPGSQPNDKPRVFVGSYVAEGGDGLVFLDLDGRKVGAIHWLGGTWTGAPFLVRDAGDKALPGVAAYTASAWQQDNDKAKGEIRVVAVTDQGAKPVVIHKLDNRKDAEVSGLAVYSGVIVVSLPKTQELLFIRHEKAANDKTTAAVLGTARLAEPRGLAFDVQGRLLALSGKTLLRYDALPTFPTTAPATQPAEVVLPKPVALVTQGLDDPQQLALDAASQVYVSDRGQSHQVKMFDAAGKPLRAIGRPGAPAAGPYDPEHMNNPNGITIDAQGRLWVAETDFQPKRVSVWSPQGKLAAAYYGPPQYGGGGTLDPLDKSRFYYHGMEFRLDWGKGANRLVGVFYRPGATVNGRAIQQHPSPHFSDGLPETPLYVAGRQYLTNCFNSHPTNGNSIVMLWLYQDGVALPVAAAGLANEWDVFSGPGGEAYKARLPEGLDFAAKNQRDKPVLFAWSDRNDDHLMQPEEVTFARTAVGPTVVQPDLSIVTGVTMQLKPQGFTPGGAPLYDATKGQTLVPGARTPNTSGGGQVLVGKDGWVVLTVPPEPYPRQSSMAGAHNGQPLWTYPSPWNGLHPSHTAPLPEQPGQILGTTRLLGGFVTPRGPSGGGGAGELWAVNGNKGNVYLLTSDGLFVATLFKDCRTASWSMPSATRGMLLNDVTLHEECFWPSITQTSDGEVYLTVGVHTTCTLVKVEGLETIRRMPTTELDLTAEQLAAAQEYFVKRDALRVEKQGRQTLAALCRDAPPVVDGKLDDWTGAQWATIDVRRRQTGDWSSVEDRATAALCVAGDRLYAAFRTGDASLLRNTAENPQLLFKTGGALDLMFGVDPKADGNRTHPAAGDLRLLVALTPGKGGGGASAPGKVVATLYRAVAPGAGAGAQEPVFFRSPWRSVSFDRVEDVSAQVQLAGAEGNFELSIPLSVLGFSPQPGMTISGDLGLLRGNGFQAMQRVYWQNKSAGLMSDVPGEAMLTPRLWGWIRFEKAGP